MPNDDISSRALSAIKDGDIEPKSKITFTSKEIVFWTVAACALAVGALAFAVILVRMVDMDWDVMPRLGLGVIFRAAPIFWVACAAVFIAIAEHYYRATAFGYRTRFILIIAAYVALTAVLGYGAYAAGLGDVIETGLSRRIPIYRQMNFTKTDMWVRPGDGLIAGRVSSTENGLIVLIDFMGQVWDVDASKALIRRQDLVAQDSLIKVIGEADGEGTFTAHEIRPWEPRHPGPMAPPPFPDMPPPRMR
ncbi:MAG: hypothetical protein V1745_02855 [Patescibacteria group bacterium]